MLPRFDIPGFRAAGFKAWDSGHLEPSGQLLLHIT